MAAFRHSQDRPGSWSPWLKLGRLLPTALRQRVFEPAYFDLLAEHQRRGRGLKRLGLKVFVLALDVYRVGGPSLLWDLRGASRKTHVFVVLLIVLVVLTAFMMTNYSYGDPIPYTPTATP